MNYKENFENYCKNYMGSISFNKPAHYADIEWQAKKKLELEDRIKTINDDLKKEAENILEQAGKDEQNDEKNLSQELHETKNRYLMSFKEKNAD